MAIEVRIPKEIKEYKEKIIFGLSLRQLISVFVGGIVCLVTYFLIKPFVGLDLASDIIMFEAMPIFAFGFIKVRSFNFETYAQIFIKHKLGNNKRYYENRICFVESNEHLSKSETKKEVKKVENIGCDKEYQGQRTVSRIAKIKNIRERVKRAKKELKKETKRKETAELDTTREQFEIAKKQYQKARKRKHKKN